MNQEVLSTKQGLLDETEGLMLEALQQKCLNWSQTDVNMRCCVSLVQGWLVHVCDSMIKIALLSAFKD